MDGTGIICVRRVRSNGWHLECHPLLLLFNLGVLVYLLFLVLLLLLLLLLLFYNDSYSLFTIGFSVLGGD